jgi:hypothetical protein
VALSVVLKSGAVPSKLSRPECGTVAGIVIPPDVMRWNGPLRQHLVLKRGRCSNATKEGPFHEVC